MTKTLRVPKLFGTYADMFLMLGIVQVAQQIQRGLYGLEKIILCDRGTAYELSLAQDIPTDEAANVAFFHLFQPVKGAKTDVSGLPPDTDFFDTVKESQDRTRYREWMRLPASEKQNLREAEQPEPGFDPRTQNGVILTSMRHDRNHNALWLSAFELQSNFGALLAAILDAFDIANSPDASVAQSIAERFKQRSGKSLPKPGSAVKVFLPTSVQGVNRSKADSNQLGSSQTEEWVILWLIAAGLLEFGLSERVKVAESTYDWRVVTLEPKEISLSDYSAALTDLRKTNPPSGAFGVARFDAEIVLKFCQTLLNAHPANSVVIQPQGRRQRGRGTSIKRIVGGFSGTHFNSKGQVYGVKEIFSLGLPDWIRPANQQEIGEYQDVLLEHLSVVRSLSADEGHSELLAAYRDFIAGSNLDQFFRFQVSYADYIVRQLADPKHRFSPARFSKQGLDIMTQSFTSLKGDKDWNLTEITENPGFLRIAKAINSATVYAGKDEHGWERRYGLAQRLSSQSGSKKDFIIEITSFLADYENENLRIDEELQKQGRPRRIWTTKEDLDHLIHLIEKFGSSLVGNLLIAYGYAKGWGKAVDHKAPGSQNSSDTDQEAA
ncbi:hypothetical protein H6F51_04875 [Cyanobacteria bacterium FACHB-DQ100]|nr:hypothetical protein [Cyanobacteria bacterium FACHB-DQ100]